MTIVLFDFLVERIMKTQLIFCYILIHFIQISIGSSIYIGHFTSSDCSPTSLFQYQQYEDSKCVPVSMTSYLLPKCQNSTITFSTGCKQGCNITECQASQNLQSKIGILSFNSNF